MTDISQVPPRRVDWVWAAIGGTVVGLPLAMGRDGLGIVADAGASLIATAPWMILALVLLGWLKAAGAEATVAKAFTGPPWRMVIAAALVGGLAPFCSCEVIPFIAALLAAGVPLAPVMAFWLASPLMDPAMFAITAGALGVPFALAKTLAAVGLGVLGGFGVLALSRSPLFVDPLRTTAASKCGCSTPSLGDAPQWQFWTDPARRTVFLQVVWETALFLGKWLAVAYLIEAVMIRHIPAEMIASVLGSDTPGTIALAALIGGPAYLNGYAAVPLIAGLVEQGMGQGVAMAFMLAGGVSCVPAAVAVWALVKPRVFAAYLAFAFVGAVLAGIGWAAWV